MNGESEKDTDQIQTDWQKRDCPHCREWHEVEVVTEPGYERQVYCPRTGDLG